jgi:hypothetical protein
MASPAQITANRLNAQHSTGPRTPEGKARSAANSLKAGYHSSTLVIPGEMRAEFDEYRRALLKMTAPANVIEEDHFRRLLLHGWNLRRVQDAETQALLDGADDPRLALLAKYRRDLERSYGRTLKDLRALQSERALRSTAPAQMRHALEAEAPLAVPPPERQMSAEEMNALFDQITAPPPSPHETFAQIQARLGLRNNGPVAASSAAVRTRQA